MALADFDRDGDLDAVVASMEEPYKLYRNNSRSSSAVTIRLEGNKENKWAIGSTVRITTELGSHWRNLIIFPRLRIGQFSVLHFGLGKAEEIKEVEITWPTGEDADYFQFSSQCHHHVNSLFGGS